jgi:hypothetical protein
MNKEKVNGLRLGEGGNFYHADNNRDRCGELNFD